MVLHPFLSLQCIAFSGWIFGKMMKSLIFSTGIFSITITTRDTAIFFPPILCSLSYVGHCMHKYWDVNGSCLAKMFSLFRRMDQTLSYAVYNICNCKMLSQQISDVNITVGRSHSWQKHQIHFQTYYEFRETVDYGFCFSPSKIGFLKLYQSLPCDRHTTHLFSLGLAKYTCITKNLICIFQSHTLAPISPSTDIVEIQWPTNRCQHTQSWTKPHFQSLCD